MLDFSINPHPTGLTLWGDSASLRRLPHVIFKVVEGSVAIEDWLSRHSKRRRRNAQAALKQTRQEFVVARASERAARDEAAELRGQLKAKK